MSYQHLGDAQLTYVADMAPVVDPTTVPVQLLGSGTGTIKGPGLNGTLRWSFFEEDCAWDPGMLNQDRKESSDLGRSLCRTYPRGVIETEDGALLQLEGQGFALRRDNDPVWIVGSTVRFITNAQHYQWLNYVLATYNGTFNERTGTATWSFQAPDV